MNHKYFILGESIPIKVTFNDKGHEIDAEVPDRKTGGLAHKATYLSRLSNSHEVEEISAEAFEIRCQAILNN